VASRPAVRIRARVDVEGNEDSAWLEPLETRQRQLPTTPGKPSVRTPERTVGAMSALRGPYVIRTTSTEVAS
jgi:hypothetical protein